MLKILEPYIISKSDEMTGKDLLNIFKSYCFSKTGSQEFFQNLLLKLMMKSGTLEASGDFYLDISFALHLCCYFIPTKVFNLENVVALFLQEIMKKIHEITEKDLYFLLDLLVHMREGNVHYYELLAIPVVKHMGKFDDSSLIAISHALAQANLSSSSCAKAFSVALRPKILSQASAIQGSSVIEQPLLTGLLGNSSTVDQEIQEMKASIFPELVKKPQKNFLINIEELFKETQHPFYNFSSFLNLSWGYLKIVVDSNVAALETNCWGLMIKLLNKHLANLNAKSGKISNVQYDKIIQIQYFSEKNWKTIEKLKIPRSLMDFSLHSRDHENIYLSP